jgi:hypothetical protein
LPKGENPLDIDFESKEIDEKAIAMQLHFIKGRCSEKCWPFWSLYKMEQFINVEI